MSCRNSAAFNRNRLRLARKRRGLSCIELSAQAGLGSNAVSRIERNANDPSAQSVQQLARALRYPVEFFQGDDIDEVNSEAVSFRNPRFVTARDRDAALAAASIGFLVSDLLEREFELTAFELVGLTAPSKPEEVAKRLRSAWGVADQPISNVIHLLELNGARVFSLAQNSRSVDTFSCWRRGVPFIFLNTSKPVERARFDVARELGHLFMDLHSARGSVSDIQANEFAAAFLMPEADVRMRVCRVDTINQVIAVKERWGVSLAAMTYRLCKLQILTRWQARMFFIEANRTGLRGSEPQSPVHETSLLWQTVTCYLLRAGLSRATVAGNARIPLDELESLVSGLMPSGSEPRERIHDRSRPGFAFGSQ